MPHNNEASVEEILESIKKVIARDNREIPPAVQIPDEGGAIASENDDVLDLGEMELAEENDPSEAPLTTDEVQKSMRDNFEALAMLAEPGARPQIVRSGETSLEGLVREMLRPMLAEWLDTNLPGMVEKMVQAEIARIAGKRG
ncbi:DUF2497 domain-containing protein [Altererythrobacter sp.]|uniref:DUF2497 domain-containing protein n=1 Tax=Altererythrobacter sp. TaxID=1872480 RepID=UPI001B10DE68|nr:DUF2497 domain-containing protein [Altererythrobacter sp.]MBO6609415.1 DUF2497 domain-containing protein [Altererythrobacter sp.]MBO6642282.1 DUF2497 domain-containing protein [Altererythrobacter sp.]MBO6709210.1 DUF2497 domain-containing protein [Altererythrobacter sp.]